MIIPVISFEKGRAFNKSFFTISISPGVINDISTSLLIILALPVTPFSPIDVPLAITFLTNPTFIKSVEPLMPVSVPAV